MPAEDQPVQEMTIRANGKKYQCFNRPLNFNPVCTGSPAFGSQQWEFHNSNECRYDMSDKDPSCSGCSHVVFNISNEDRKRAEALMGIAGSFAVQRRARLLSELGRRNPGLYAKSKGLLEKMRENPRYLITLALGVREDRHEVFSWHYLDQTNDYLVLEVGIAPHLEEPGLIPTLLSWVDSDVGYCAIVVRIVAVLEGSDGQRIRVVALVEDA